MPVAQSTARQRNAVAGAIPKPNRSGQKAIRGASTLRATTLRIDPRLEVSRSPRTSSPTWKKSASTPNWVSPSRGATAANGSTVLPSRNPRPSSSRMAGTAQRARGPAANRAHSTPTSRISRVVSRLGEAIGIKGEQAVLPKVTLQAAADMPAAIDFSSGIDASP